MYLIIIILNSVLALSESLLPVENDFLGMKLDKRSRRDVQIYPPGWKFTTVSPEDEPPYNKYVQPDKPKVTFGFHIEQMRTVSEIEKTFSFDAISTANWTDLRVADFLSISKDSWNWAREIELKADTLDDIWHPDINFDPLVSVVESEASSKMFLGRRGEVRMSKFGRYTFSCDMDLLYFPFDRHKCFIMISAYRMDVDVGKMRKNTELFFSMKPGQLIGNLRFNDLNHSTDYKFNVAAVVEYTHYMQHALFLKMSRNPMYYMLTLFIPNTVLTCLSWVVMWIDPLALPERANICIALILAQVILIIGEEQSFPQSADFKIIDAYLIVNFLMNVASLIETLLASCSGKKLMAKRNREVINQKRTASTHDNESEEKLKNESSVEVMDQNGTKSDHSQLALDPSSSLGIEIVGHEFNSYVQSTEDYPDRICRILSPVSFLIWNVSFFFLFKYFANIAYDKNDPQPPFLHY